MLNITYTLKPEHKRTRIDDSLPFGFGKLRTDHMFLTDYANSLWQNPRIVPYANVNVPMGSLGLNLGQSIFEGCKAFKHEDKEVYLFRLDQHTNRLNNSARMLCMPQIPPEDQIQAISSLIDIDRHHAPDREGSFLYIRPVMFATEDCLCARDGNSYQYGVILSPSENLFGNALQPIKLLLTKKFHRVAPGSTGSAKTGGNYGNTLFALQEARTRGAQQVLYLDVTNTYVEETGTMNHYHVTKAGKIVIPEFTDTILESITSRSMLELSDRLGHEVVQEKVLYADFRKNLENGEIVEAGGLGTGAGVSPVGSYILDDGREVRVGDGKVGSVTKKMYELLTGIQTGKREAPEGWLKKVSQKSRK